MLLAIAAVVFGLIVLVWAADRFVIGAAALARNLGVAPLLIGLTIVGFGTSAPEIMVSGMAAWQGNPGLAIGNAIGSNIANIALILGVTALLSPLVVKSGILRREYPLLLGVSLITYLLLLDGQLSFWNSLFLLFGLIASLSWLVYISTRKAHTSDSLAKENAAEIPTNMSTQIAIFWFVLGLLLLVASSRVLVWGAIQIAVFWGVSDLVIGLTIVAIGTSLPELAASIASALKNEHDMAVGNIIGSNLYNLLAVLPVPGLVASTLINQQVLIRDFPVMLGLTVALLLMGVSRKKRGRINRVEGAVLVCCFIAYQGWLMIEMQQAMAT